MHSIGFLSLLRILRVICRATQLLQEISPVYVALLHLNVSSEINHFHLKRLMINTMVIYVAISYCKRPEGEQRQEELEYESDNVGTSGPDRTQDEIQRMAF